MDNAVAARVLASLQLFLQDHLSFDSSPVVPEGHFVDLGIDSFALMELVLFAEREYSVKLPLARVARSASLSDVTSILLDALDARNKAA